MSGDLCGSPIKVSSIGSIPIEATKTVNSPIPSSIFVSTGNGAARYMFAGSEASSRL
jgi:hypothetical protein